MATSIRGGIHRLHDQKTTLRPTLFGTPRRTALVTGVAVPRRRISERLSCPSTASRSSARHSVTPTRSMRMVGRMPSRGLASSSASGSHLMASTGRLPTSWTRRPVSMRTGASAQLRSSMRPSEPLRAVPALPSASCVPRREFAGRCCVDRSALRSWSCQSGALGPSAWTKGAARSIAIGSLRRRSRERARVRTPSPRHRRAPPDPGPGEARVDESSQGKPFCGQALPGRWARDRGGRSWNARRSDSAGELRQRRVMNSVG